MKTNSFQQNKNNEQQDICSKIYFLYSKHDKTENNLKRDISTFNEKINCSKIQKDFDSGKDVIDFYTNQKVKFEQTKFLIFQSDKLQYTSISKSDSHHYKQKTGIERNYNSDWILGISIFVLILLVLIKFYYKNLIKNTFQSTINFKFSESFYYEKKKLSDRSDILLNFIFFLNISVYIFQILAYYKIPINNKQNIVVILSIFIFIMLLDVFHRLSNFFIGKIFSLENEFSQYNSNIKNFNHIIGIVFIPLIVLFAYTKSYLIQQIIYFSVSLVIIVMILRWLRMFQIFLKKHVSFLYLFLYLCTLEIIPLALLIIFIINYFADIQ